MARGDAADLVRFLLPATANRAAGHGQLKQAQEFLHRPEEAIKEYQSLLKLFPTDSLALNAAMRVGAMYFSQEKFKEAADAFYSSQRFLDACATVYGETMPEMNIISTWEIVGLDQGSGWRSVA